ncbi:MULTISPECIES: S-Ena type endospore appendage [Priestia]|uniref:S-Ena type endospore appendage n=1 Tax=Priestia TaxID=2800373 RepID=UPI001C8D0479|nr:MULTISPECIES: S-Ena type endospore appendage [Priestia]MBY0061744.1 hypothetical protein [Priestia aryabhattai]MDN3362291.1 hypothetical protein [Priestia megaterium]WKU21766.1 hypothetical protein Q3A90_18550 [Priestia megaterium]
MGCNSDTNSAVLGNCFNQTEYVKDQLCTQFSITDVAAVVIYEAINESVIASFVLKNTGTIDFAVTVTNSAGGIIIPVTTIIPPGQSLLRTVDNLGSISITAAGAAPETPAKGQLDIVVRYALD